MIEELSSKKNSCVLRKRNTEQDDVRSMKGKVTKPAIKD
jgi:hypothetical protein